MRKTLEDVERETLPPLTLIRVNPDKIKSVLVMVYLARHRKRLIDALNVPGQMGIGRSDWGYSYIWYTGSQFNAMVERVKAAGIKPKWRTHIFRSYPPMFDNRFTWNASRTESTPVKD